MKVSQPAWALRARDEQNNIAAVSRLLSRVRRPERVLEFFGGIGGITKVALQLWPDVAVQTWDLDPTCVQMLRDSFPTVDVHQGDSAALAEVRRGDGCLMDFNVWTLARAQHEYAAVMKRVFSAQPDWVQVADSAAGRLHLNYRSYGLNAPVVADYLSQIDSWAQGYGWRLMASERSHFHTHMLMFEAVK